MPARMKLNGFYCGSSTASTRDPCVAHHEGSPSQTCLYGRRRPHCRRKMELSGPGRGLLFRQPGVGVTRNIRSSGERGRFPAVRIIRDPDSTLDPHGTLYGASARLARRAARRTEHAGGLTLAYRGKIGGSGSSLRACADGKQLPAQSSSSGFRQDIHFQSPAFHFRSPDVEMSH